MHKLLEKLKRDHVNLEKLVILLSAQLDNFFAGRESDFDLKIELLEYLELFADQGHHRLENLIFNTVKERLSEKQEIVERLISQHSKLVTLTRKFRQSLEGVLQGDVMLRDELEAQGREYLALQRQHIDLEEREIFPLLDEIVTDEEWQEIIKTMPKEKDPVFDSPDKVRFQKLYEYLAQQ